MPVVHRPLNEQTRPEWCRVTRAGIFRVPTDGGMFDRHHHDCDEYWLIFAGRAKVMTEGVECYVGPGDVVCTRAGDDHDVLEVYEDLAGWFFEDELLPGGRPGHLHREGWDGRHAVPHLPLPADYDRPED